MMVHFKLEKFDADAIAQPNARQSLRSWLVQILGLVGVAWFGVVQPAAAHHFMGGRTPATFLEGFLSGLGHPVVGLDHLAFVVAIALVSINLTRGILLPGCFLLTAMAGTGLHLAGLNLPASESVIAISVIAFGIILALGKRLDFPILVMLASIAGLFHGYAYGESIFGAESTPLVAYLLGFTLIQGAIALLTFWIGSKVTQTSPRTASSAIRYVGYAISIIGVVFLSTTLHG